MYHKVCLLVILAISVGACSTTSYKQANYSGPLELYPAVLSVFEDMHARVDKFNLKSNVFISERVYNQKLNLKYNIKVSYQNKIIKAELLNVKQPHAHHKTRWVPYKDFFPLDDSAIRQTVESEIMTILLDTERYHKIKTDILNELGFHYLVARNLPNADALKWIASHMSGKKFMLHLMNYDPEFRVNDTTTAPHKKYIAHFRYDSQKWVTTDFDLDLYTNNASYKKMPLNSHITTLAEFITAKVQIYIVTFGFSFEQLAPEI